MVHACMACECMVCAPGGIEALLCQQPRGRDLVVQGAELVGAGAQRAGVALQLRDVAIHLGEVMEVLRAEKKKNAQRSSPC